MGNVVTVAALCALGASAGYESKVLGKTALSFAAEGGEVDAIHALVEVSNPNPTSNPNPNPKILILRIIHISSVGWRECDTCSSMWYVGDGHGHLMRTSRNLSAASATLSCNLALSIRIPLTSIENQGTMTVLNRYARVEQGDASNVNTPEPGALVTN